MKNITKVINFILDESGSMEEIKDATIKGFNEYVGGLKNSKSKVLFTLTKFDSKGLRTPYVLTDVKEVKPLNTETFVPGAWTPLYDAIVETVEKVADKVKENQASLVVVMTDGEENSSKKHNEKCLRDLIHKLEHKGNWTFVFLGANQDSWAIASKLGYSEGNVMDWQSSDAGTRTVFNSMAVSSINYIESMEDNAAKGASLNASNFFEKK